MATQAFNLPPIIDIDGLREMPYFPSEAEDLSDWLGWIEEERPQTRTRRAQIPPLGRAIDQGWILVEGVPRE